MERIQQILNRSTNATAVNQDFGVKIALSNTAKLLPDNEIDYRINSATQFNVERQACSTYRFVGDITPNFTNVLFDITQESLSALTNSNVEVPLLEQNGWFGYYKPNSNKLCDYQELAPDRNNFTLVPNNNINNWELLLTYPYSADTTHNLVVNGLLIVDKVSITSGGKDMIGFTTPVKHNLVAGDTVRITGLGGLDNDFNVVQTGDNLGNDTEYIFVIDLPSTTAISANTRMKRLNNGQESTYYFRLFKSISDNNDYEFYNLAFSNNLYNDTIAQFAFNSDIDVSKFSDNLGRPLSELYVTMIKQSNSEFSIIKSGLDIPYIGNLVEFPSIPDIRRIHNVSSYSTVSHIPLETSVLGTNNLFYGDVVEYNNYDVEEIILGEVSHRFNTLNRDNTTINSENTPRPEGYYYKPHHLIKIRQYSNYIEQGDISLYNLPSYAQDLGDGRFLWRDLLSIGYNDVNDTVLDYPFLNGRHYLHTSFDLSLKRQDPFNIYELYYKTLPRDIYGDKTNNVNFTTNSGNNVC